MSLLTSFSSIRKVDIDRCVVYLASTCHPSTRTKDAVSERQSLYFFLTSQNANKNPFSNSSFDAEGGSRPLRRVPAPQGGALPQERDDAAVEREPGLPAHGREHRHPQDDREHSAQGRLLLPRGQGQSGLQIGAGPCLYPLPSFSPFLFGAFSLLSIESVPSSFSFSR